MAHKENSRRTLLGILSLLLELGFDLPSLDGALQRRVVLLVLVRVGDGEGRERLVEGVAPPHVPAEQDRGARARVGERERPSTPGGVEIHFGGAEGLHADADLDVPQLADKEVSLGARGPPVTV